MRESTAEAVTTAPKVQKLERLLTIEKEHKDALERAVSLNVPHAVTVTSPQDAPSQVDKAESSVSQIHDASKTTLKSTGGRTNWDEVVKKLFKKDEAGELCLKIEANAPQ